MQANPAKLFCPVLVCPQKAMFWIQFLSWFWNSLIKYTWKTLLNGQQWWVCYIVTIRFQGLFCYIDFILDSTDRSMQELQKFNASKQSHKQTCYSSLQSIWQTFCGIPTINKKNVMSLLKIFPMKTPPLLLWSWLGVVSMVKALKVGLKGPSMWPFLSQAMPFHWFWSCCSTLECYKGTVYISKNSKLLHTA